MLENLLVDACDIVPICSHILTLLSCLRKPMCLTLIVCLTLSCSERNFLGLNQKLSALVELGQADSLFRLQWVDPWIHGDPNRTSRTLSVMNTRSAQGRHTGVIDRMAHSKGGGGWGRVGGCTRLRVASTVHSDRDWEGRLPYAMAVQVSSLLGLDLPLNVVVANRLLCSPHPPHSHPSRTHAHPHIHTHVSTGPCLPTCT